MNEFETSLQSSKKEVANAAVQTTIGRYMQEVQGMVYMSKQFPRDQFTAWQKIKESCQRKSLAEVAQYEYPRGGQKVSGPSIRLAEVLAQNWGNFSSGIIELEQKLGESQVMAFAWDLENNTRSEMIFTVKHERKAKGKIDKLTDPRDIYEMVANLGARRKRACILANIPKDIVEAAMEECEATLAGDNKEPISDRLKKMLDKFKEFGVTKAMVEKRAGYKLETFTEKDIIGLVKVYNSLKDGIGTREEFFESDKSSTSDSKVNEEFLKHLKEQEEKERKAAEANVGSGKSAS